MAFILDMISKKKEGDLIESQDWNDAMIEISRLGEEIDQINTALQTGLPRKQVTTVTQTLEADTVTDLIKLETYKNADFPKMYQVMFETRVALEVSFHLIYKVSRTETTVNIQFKNETDEKIEFTAKVFSLSASLLD